MRTKPNNNSVPTASEEMTLSGNSLVNTARDPDYKTDTGINRRVFFIERDRLANKVLDINNESRIIIEHFSKSGKFTIFDFDSNLRKNLDKLKVEEISNRLSIMLEKEGKKIKPGFSKELRSAITHINSSLLSKDEQINLVRTCLENNIYQPPAFEQK